MSNIICFFGDSITWGAVDPEHGGWVALLRRHLELNNYGAEIYNQGVSGDNTDKLLVRFKTEAEARKAQTIIFAIGVNDSQYIQRRENPRVSLENFRKNLIELIKEAQEITDRIAFIGLTRVEDEKLSPIP